MGRNGEPVIFDDSLGEWTEKRVERHLKEQPASPAAARRISRISQCRRGLDCAEVFTVNQRLLAPEMKIRQRLVIFLKELRFRRLHHRLLVRLGCRRLVIVMNDFGPGHANRGLPAEQGLQAKIRILVIHEKTLIKEPAAGWKNPVHIYKQTGTG